MGYAFQGGTEFAPESSKLALGYYDQIVELDKYGHVEGLDAVDPDTDVWMYGSDGEGGTPTMNFDLTAATMYAASTDNSDTMDLVVTYIDSSGAEQTATVTLTGQTPVSLGDSGSFVNLAYTTGSAQEAGNITITNENNFTSGVPNDKTKVMAYIRAGWGKTKQSGYVSPTNVSSVVKRLYVSLARASGAPQGRDVGGADVTVKTRRELGSAEVHVRQRSAGQSVWSVSRDIHVTSSSTYDRAVAIVLEPGDAIVGRCVNISDTDTNVAVEFDMDIIAR